jgi:hypothetical protein
MVITFDKARLLNENVPTSSGGETVILARLDGEPVAEIVATREDRGFMGWEYRVTYYEVEWLDGREEADLCAVYFEAKEHGGARKALTAARNYIRRKA